MARFSDGAASAREQLRSSIPLMVTIRLARAGAKRRPFYHVVIADEPGPA